VAPAPGADYGSSVIDSLARLAPSRRSFLAAIAATAALPRAAHAMAVEATPPDSEHLVVVEGGRIYVRINGPLHGAGMPLIMAHGGPGGTHAGFLPALELADSRAVILYDQLDCGRSDTPGDPANWRVARFVDEVDGIRRALGLERVHFLGASWGGTIALEYGARRPPGLASLVLQSPLVATEPWLDDAAILRRRLPADVRTALTACDTGMPPPAALCDAATRAFYARFNRIAPPSPEQIAYRSRLTVPFNQRLYQSMWGASEFVSTGSLRNYDGRPLLRRLPRQTLFMAGEFDEARPRTVASFAARVKGAQVKIIRGAAHGIANDQPQAWLAALRPWLAAHDRATTGA
jgi:proline iminopeptidase/L-proline amide hydrolase